MTRSLRRWTLGVTTAAALVVIVPVGLAWACVGLVSLTTSSSTVQAGGTLTVTGKEFASGAPVLIHLDTIDGPVLATAPAPKSTMTSQFKIDVTIPSNISTGQHVLVATQTEHNMNGGNPARALIYVGTAAPAAAGPAARPTDLIANTGKSAVSLILIGLGVTVLALLVAGVLMRVMGRRSADSISA